MRNARNLAWKLNWFRHSELEGALVLGKLLYKASDAYLIQQLTRHCADEARHAWIWDRTIRQLGLPTLQIARSYQSFYRDEIEPPRGIVETLALTHVFEKRVDRQFTEELEHPDTPEGLRRTLLILLRDEKGHLDWIAEWLSTIAGAGTLLRRYYEADERVYRRLSAHRDRIWEIAAFAESEKREAADVRIAQRDATKLEHSAQART